MKKYPDQLILMKNILRIMFTQYLNKFFREGKIKNTRKNQL